MDRPKLLAALCEDYPDLKLVADRTGRSAEFAAIVRAARTGEPIEELLRSAGLLSALQGGASRGLPGTPGEGAIVGLAGVAPGGHVARGDYRCPTDACLRVARPGAGEDRPVCGLHGRALRFEGT